MCGLEFPDAEIIHRRYRDQGVRVLGLHSGEAPDAVLAFQEQTGVTFPLRDGGFSLWEFSFPPGVGYPYPRDVIIDADNRVRAIRNSFDVDEVDALIQQLIDERDAP